MDIWTAVKVKTDTHPRFNQAGTVQQRSPAHADEVGVKFDADGVVEVVAIADLQAL